MWGGRFDQHAEKSIVEFNASIHFDKRLYQEDVAGSIAHTTMLAEVGILTTAESEQIITGLQQAKQKIQKGEVVWSSADEDIHMAVERIVTESVGEVGKKMHTARSRNDQVATDIRLHLKTHIHVIAKHLLQMMQVLTETATKYATVAMPGFTHLQPAQPITFGHHLLAWYSMVERDYQRLCEVYQRVDVSPLGSGALAGTPHPINRKLSADLLNFSTISNNSLDAVSDRDFAIDFCYFVAMTLMHLSRWCEEMIIWSSPLFGFIDLPDSHCTGSSMMPQKKNPDVAELVRGKTARTYGSVMALLTLMKGQPLAYNKDNQEDKEPLFDSIDTVESVLPAMISMVAVMTPNAKKMRAALHHGHVAATDLADYLVGKGVAFRDAHHSVGVLVTLAIKQHKSLEELSITEFQSVNKNIDEDVYQHITVEAMLAARNHTGGTAPQQVLLQCNLATEHIASQQERWQ